MAALVCMVMNQLDAIFLTDVRLLASQEQVRSVGSFFMRLATARGVRRGLGHFLFNGSCGDL
jgi:hypothetical protein